jgi:hypothetical protein
MFNNVRLCSTTLDHVRSRESIRPKGNRLPIKFRTNFEQTGGGGAFLLLAVNLDTTWNKFWMKNLDTFLTENFGQVLATFALTQARKI